MGKKSGRKRGPRRLCPKDGKKINKCPGHRSLFSWKLLLLLLLMVIIFVFLLSQPAGKQTARVDSTEAIKPGELIFPGNPSESNHQLILQKLTDKNISEVYTPVHIFKNGKFWASGVLFQGQRETIIITAAHLFLKDEAPAYYSYQVLRPFENKLHDISHLTRPEITNPKNVDVDLSCPLDVIFCIAGGKQLIEGFATRRYELSRKITVSPLPELTGNMDFTSLVTAESYKCLGRANPLSGLPVYYFSYAPIPGESGTGFINNRGDLLIISGTMPVTKDFRKFFSLPESATKISAGVLLTQ